VFGKAAGEADDDVVLHDSITLSTCIGPSIVMPEQSRPGPRILIIGGTQFMGRHLTERLLKHTEYTIGLLNRGRTKSPFNFDGRRLLHLKCDRFDRHSFRRVLRTTGPWNFVIDFLCFRRRNAKDVVAALWPACSDETLSQDRSLKCYVMISTDSVYMPCRPSCRKNGILESDAIPPRSVREQRVVASRDPYQLEYGGGKLEAEKYLHTTCKEIGFPFVALRLPDVIGPYDNQTGFLGLRRRVLKRKKIGLRIGNCCSHEGCSGRTHRVSIVFAADVARLIHSIIEQLSDDHSSCSSSAIGKAFNVACIEQLTFLDFVTLVASHLDQSPKYSLSKDAPMVTVDVGPVNTDLVRETFNFTPSSIRDVVATTLKWFERSRHRKYTRDLDRSSSSDDESDDEASSQHRSGSAPSSGTSSSTDSS